MQISMYETLVPSMNRMLGNLAKILDKAAAFAEARKVDPAVLLNSRLAPDMFSLTRQVQIACDMAKGAAGRLGGGEIPKFEDDETSIAELKARIAKTLAYINGVGAAGYEGAEDRDIVLQLRSGELRFKGLSYLRDFVLPNVYFHITTAYGILRNRGVALGKPDYLGGA